MFVVRTTNGKTLSGYSDRAMAETSRAYWQNKIDNSPLARGTKVEVREVKESANAQR
jgi:hypothetical protein